MISPDINAIREQVSLALIEDLGGELNAHNDITAVSYTHLTLPTTPYV